MPSTSTVQHAIEEVAHYLDDATHKRWSPQAIYHAVRRASESVARDAALAAPMKFAAAAAYAFNPAQTEYDLPPDFAFAIALLRTDGACAAPLDVIGFHESSGTHGWYVRAGKLGLRLYGAAQLELRYVRRVPPPDALADVFGFDEEWVELVVLRAARKLLAQKGLPHAHIAVEEAGRLDELRDMAEPYARDFSGERFEEARGECL